MADNSAQNATDTIRDKDRAGIKTQIFGLDLGIGTGSESLMAGYMPIQGLQAARQTANITTAASVVGPYAATSYNVATVTISGTYASVTFIFEASDDGGTNYYTVMGTRSDTGIIETGGTLLTNTVRAWDIPLGGFNTFRVRATAWTSGTAVVGVNLQSMPFEPAPTVIQGTPGATAWPTSPTPSATTTGLTTFFNNALVATVVSVKSSAGKVHGWQFQNPNTIDCWVQIFDLATGSVTLGTTAPKKSIWVPSGGESDYMTPLGVAHATAISVAATTTSNGLTAPTTGLVTNVDFI